VLKQLETRHSEAKEEYSSTAAKLPADLRVLTLAQLAGR